MPGLVVPQERRPGGRSGILPQESRCAGPRPARGRSGARCLGQGVWTTWARTSGRKPPVSHPNPLTPPSLPQMWTLRRGDPAGQRSAVGRCRFALGPGRRASRGQLTGETALHPVVAAQHTQESPEGLGRPAPLFLGSLESRAWERVVSREVGSGEGTRANGSEGGCSEGTGLEARQSQAEGGHGQLWKRPARPSVREPAGVAPGWASGRRW